MSIKTRLNEPSATQVSTSSLQPIDATTLDYTINRASHHLLGLQYPGGYWVGELEADSSVTADYIPLMHFMTGHVDREKQEKVVEYVLSEQLDNGLWPSYSGGPGDLNVSVQNYFALKLAGVSTEDIPLRKAKDSILDFGGLYRINTLTKFWLALFGQYNWQKVPEIPVELMLLPNRGPFSIYDFASWSRATIVALMVIRANQPICPIPETAKISELEDVPKNKRPHPQREWIPGWEGFFYNLDQLLKIAQRLPVKPGRANAMRKAEEWIVNHQEADGSWGGIMLPWAYSLMALKSLGYGTDSPVVRKGLAGLDEFIIEGDRTLRLQPATSPVWDTAWSVVALRESGLPPDNEQIVRGARWLLNQEVRWPGDWQVKNKSITPGGWAFEFENDIYPDIDDTAVVPRALLRADFGPDKSTCDKAIERALQWSIRMQCNNGGWAAFDRNNNKKFLEKVPFADFMTPLDPTSPDVTAHVLELLGELKQYSPAVTRALAYLRREQYADGSWRGRWGVNYIYGTGLVLSGLRAIGEDISQEYINKAIRWLESHQNPDGGWGETCQTYDKPDLKGKGISTASQTAWAVMGLISATTQGTEAINQGVKYLIETQKPDGSWQEDVYTGTGFPRAFYLKYDLYRIYFPLWALSLYRKVI
jgi:squalene-hopene/tetraprenyl-beta-curcumene cyclase